MSAFTVNAVETGRAWMLLWMIVSVEVLDVSADAKGWTWLG